MYKPEDRIGFKFNRLTVVSIAERNMKTGRPRWNCRCACGNMTVVETPHFKKTISCGCYLKEIRQNKSKNFDKLKNHSLYSIWKSMKQRCCNPKTKAFKYYGARGIKRCSRWDDFKMFEKDVLSIIGPRPSMKHSIDRRDGNIDYRPDNIRWATQEIQCNNRSDNRRIECSGIALTVPQWSRRNGIGVSAIHARIARRWNICRAVTNNPP